MQGQEIEHSGNQADLRGECGIAPAPSWHRPVSDVWGRQHEPAGPNGPDFRLPGASIPAHAARPLEASLSDFPNVPTQ